jgi:hypothetical protein
MQVASDLQKNQGIWPNFIYFYIINPRRFNEAANLLLTEVTVCDVVRLPSLRTH